MAAGAAGSHREWRPSGLGSLGGSIPGMVPEMNPVRTEFDGAIGFVRAAVAARPDAGMARMELGMILTAAGHLDEAIATLQQLTPLFADGKELDFLLGSALLSSGRRSEALPYLKRSAERQPDDEWLQYALGATLAELGNDDEAREALLNVAIPQWE